jgi:hypothetical protein
LSNGRRTATELDDAESRNIFHINWFVLEYPWVDEDEKLDQFYTTMTQELYGDMDIIGSEKKKLGVSFTV